MADKFLGDEDEGVATLEYLKKQSGREYEYHDGELYEVLGDVYATGENYDPTENAFDASPASELSANSFCATGKGGGVDAHCSLSSKKTTPRAKQKFVGKIVGFTEHKHATEIEQKVAKLVDGRMEENNKFFDVETNDGKHFVEVKTMMLGQKKTLSVHPDALLRKVEGMKENKGSTFHTVLFDEREKYQGGVNKSNYSGHRIYYKRGSGPYSISKMYKVNNEAELRKLMDTPDGMLPEEAKGSLPKGMELKRLRLIAERTHESRLRKDRARKAKLKAMGTSAYERQT